MRTLDYIDDLINTIDKSLENFATEVSPVISFLKSDFDIDFSIKNERTLSTLANNEILSFFSDSEVEIIKIDEMYITPNTKLTGDELKEIMSSFKGSMKKVKDSWERMYIDGYFFDNTDSSSLFVEYKLDDKFKYVDLAQDFLKYKIYTYNSTGNSTFLFAVFDKKGIYPTIKSGKKPQFILIEDTIDKSMFEPSDKVIIYEDLRTTSSKTSIKDTIQKYAVLSSIRKHLYNEKNEPYDFIDMSSSLKTDPFFLKRSRFKTHVITAKVILKNYNLIYASYSELLKKDEFMKILDAFDLVANNGNDTYMDWLFSKYSNYESEFEEPRYRSQQELLNANY